MPKFLIIRFSSIGDIVLTTPVIRCIKQQIPDAEIHYLTKPVFGQLIAHNPYIDKIWDWEEEQATHLFRELRKQRFTHIIDLHHNLRSLRVKATLCRPSSSFRKLNVSKYLMVRFKVNRLPDLHIVGRYLETVRDLGVINDGKGLDYFLPEGTESSVKNRLPGTFRNGYIALVCGALKATKRMPPEMLAEIVRKLNLPVVLLGGKAETAIAAEIEKDCPGKDIFNACGIFSLDESAACIKNAKAVVTHDTGLMHIAAAFHKPIVSIWGNTIPEFGMQPYLTDEEHLSILSEVKNLYCRPCSKIGFDKCPKGHFRCMRDQKPEAIAAAVSKLTGN